MAKKLRSSCSSSTLWGFLCRKQQESSWFWGNSCINELCILCSHELANQTPPNQRGNEQSNRTTSKPGAEHWNFKLRTHSIGFIDGRHSLRPTKAHLVFFAWVKGELSWHHAGVVNEVRQTLREHHRHHLGDGSLGALTHVEFHRLSLLQRAVTLTLNTIM